MVYTTRMYPRLMFYIKVADPEFADRGGLKSYFFDRGIFDTDDVSDEDRPLVEIALDKMLNQPGSSVFLYEDKGRYECQVCSRLFKSVDALNGHKPYHKYSKQIDEESAREGAIPINQ